MTDYNFSDYEADKISRPFEECKNWAKFEEVGDKVQGFVADATYRKPEGQFKEQRVITLTQPNGELVNVAIKRLTFILSKTNDLRVGDPLTVVFEKQLEPRQKGYKGVKVLTFFGKNLEENEGNPTVAELEAKDMSIAQTVVQEVDEEFENPLA